MDRWRAIDSGWIAELLEAWRRSRDPELASLIERAGALLPEPRVAGSPAQIAATLLAEPHDVRVVQRHLPQLQRKHATALLELAEQAPPDPRWGPYLAGWLDTRPFISGRELWKATLRLLAHTGDVRTLERLQQGIESMPFETASFIGAQHWNTCAQEVEAVQVRPVDLDLDGIRARIEQAEAQRAHRERERNELWSRVAQHRDPDSALVLADQLQEEGDPRGEFIVLQARATPDRDERARMKRLLDQHWQAWLGDLASVALRRGLRFELGVPEAIAVAFKSIAQFEALLDSPVWASVRDVGLRTTVSWDRRVARQHPVVRLLGRHPQIHTVRELNPWAINDLLFGDQPLALDAVHLEGAQKRWPRVPDGPLQVTSLAFLEIPHGAAPSAVTWMRRGLRVHTLHVRHLPTSQDYQPEVTIDTPEAAETLRKRLARYVSEVRVWYGAKNQGPV